MCDPDRGTGKGRQESCGAYIVLSSTCLDNAYLGMRYHGMRQNVVSPISC
jgi:hypothetical protein